MSDLITLTNALIKSTGEGNLKWEAHNGVGNDREYSASVGKYIVSILNYVRPIGGFNTFALNAVALNEPTGSEIGYIIRLLSVNGEIVGMLDLKKGQEGFDILDRLYQDALNSARGVSSAIDEILSVLRSSEAA